MALRFPAPPLGPELGPTRPILYFDLKNDLDVEGVLWLCDRFDIPLFPLWDTLISAKERGVERVTCDVYRYKLYYRSLERGST